MPKYELQNTTYKHKQEKNILIKFKFIKYNSETNCKTEKSINIRIHIQSEIIFHYINQKPGSRIVIEC